MLLVTEIHLVLGFTRSSLQVTEIHLVLGFTRSSLLVTEIDLVLGLWILRPWSGLAEIHLDLCWSISWSVVD